MNNRMKSYFFQCFPLMWRSLARWLEVAASGWRLEGAAFFYPDDQSNWRTSERKSFFSSLAPKKKLLSKEQEIKRFGKSYKMWWTWTDKGNEIALFCAIQNCHLWLRKAQIELAVWSGNPDQKRSAFHPKKIWICKRNLDFFSLAKTGSQDWLDPISAWFNLMVRVGNKQTKIQTFIWFQRNLDRHFEKLFFGESFGFFGWGRYQARKSGKTEKLFPI